MSGRLIFSVDMTKTFLRELFESKRTVHWDFQVPENSDQGMLVAQLDAFVAEGRKVIFAVRKDARATQEMELAVFIESVTGKSLAHEVVDWEALGLTMDDMVVMPMDLRGEKTFVIARTILCRPDLASGVGPRPSTTVVLGGS